MFTQVKALVLVGAVAMFATQTFAAQSRSESMSRTAAISGTVETQVLPAGNSAGDIGIGGPICHDGPGLGGGY